jgi:hypothetical protein
MKLMANNPLIHSIQNVAKLAKSRSSQNQFYYLFLFILFVIFVLYSVIKRLINLQVYSCTNLICILSNKCKYIAPSQILPAARHFRPRTYIQAFDRFGLKSNVKVLARSKVIIEKSRGGSFLWNRN